jgi:8-oxo-dGTP diphosphatase
MYTYAYPRPAVTVDAVIFRKTDNSIEVLLIQRGHDPFIGMWACPGGFIDMQETPEDAAIRELEEETGLKDVELFQFHAYGSINRDPRHRTIAIAYAGFLKNNSFEVKGGDDAAEARWFTIGQLPELAFDHDQIVADAIEFAKGKYWF